MDATEIRKALGDFAAESMRDDAGVQPDAKLEMEWTATGDGGLLIGPISEGESEPRGGTRTRSIDMRFKFASLTPRWAASASVLRMTSALASDPHLGGRIRKGHARLRSSRMEDDQDGDWLATVAVRVSTFE